MDRFTYGKRVKVTVTVKRTDSSALTNFTTGKIRFRSPSGVVTDKEYPGTVVNDSTGKYSVEFVFLEEGEWSIRLENDLGAVEESWAVVNKTDFYP